MNFSSEFKSFGIFKIIPSFKPPTAEGFNDIISSRSSPSFIFNLKKPSFGKTSYNSNSSSSTTIDSAKTILLGTFILSPTLRLSPIVGFRCSNSVMVISYCLAIPNLVSLGKTVCIVILLLDDLDEDLLLFTIVVLINGILIRSPLFTSRVYKSLL